MANQYKFLHMDSRKVFPFESKTVDLIVSSHMLEHSDWNEGLNFLRECYRVMKVGAVMRIAVPDLATMVVKYLNGNLHKLDEINLNAASNDQQSFKFWSYLFDNHKIAYDINSLTKIGNLAGFQVERKGFNEGHPEIIRETMDYLPEISIYVEMTKSV
jgi:predicted SAM-dependent methyltransferase